MLWGGIVQAHASAHSRLALQIFKSHVTKLVFIIIQTVIVLLGLCGSLMVTGLWFRVGSPGPSAELCTCRADLSFLPARQYYYNTYEESGIVISFNQAVGMWLWCSCIVVSLARLCARKRG